MFDPWALDMALRWIPPYPLGALVTLSDGREGVVTDLNSARPCEPTVGILPSRGAGMMEIGEEVNLAAPDTPRIVKYMDRDVSKHFYTLPTRPPALEVSPISKESWFDRALKVQG